MSGTHKIVGPAPIMKAIGVIAAVIGFLALLGFPDPVAISLAIPAVLIAWRFLGLAINIDGSDLVMRNLFYSQRIPLDRVQINWSSRDIRTSLLNTAQAAKPSAIPKLADDHTPTDMKVVQITDTADPDTLGFSQCFVGVVPAKQEAFYNKLSDAVIAAQNRLGH